ncbi:hypothetical protein [Natrialbaceae archaeon AArc-T1-2]|uniref:hypothetical protein n=1 Tax=Natrialbaceae archaeon AArc-T1-2 TaxID=3053904 RepID=UPI00255A8CF5|nr:hypothetical protein [Natrialbaceae archaeon AArc-T1-2]WIV66511.1 hypothetical protein QQ977_12525 [Natrialbaceae archaeon AArc-T1-2]
MSNIPSILVTCTRIGTKARRTIAHSPDFPDPDADSSEDSPAGRVPPGGYLTG